MNWKEIDVHGKMLCLLIYGILGGIGFLFIAAAIEILRHGF